MSRRAPKQGVLASTEHPEVCKCRCPRFRHTVDGPCRGCGCEKYDARDPRADPVDNCTCGHRRTRHHKRLPRACTTCKCLAYQDARQPRLFE